MWRPPASRETARRSNKDKINGAIVYDRDFEYDYFGFKTLERSYLMRCDGDIAERPQHMIMRVAIGIHGQDARSRRPRIATEFNKKEHWSLPLVETITERRLAMREDRRATLS